MKGLPPEMPYQERVRAPETAKRQIAGVPDRRAAGSAFGAGAGRAAVLVRDEPILASSGVGGAQRGGVAMNQAFEDGAQDEVSTGSDRRGHCRPSAHQLPQSGCHGYRVSGDDCSLFRWPRQHLRRKGRTAPPDLHLLVRDGRIELWRGPKKITHSLLSIRCSSAAAETYGPRVIGVILTGLLDDGTAGLLEIKRRDEIGVSSARCWKGNNWFYMEITDEKNSPPACAVTTLPAEPGRLLTKKGVLILEAQVPARPGSGRRRGAMAPRRPSAFMLTSREDQPRRSICRSFS
jgi:hypothetical protein